MHNAQLSVTHINQLDQLEELMEAAREFPHVALDTEFIRTDTFYPKAALIQIAFNHQCYLIDPLAIPDLTPMAALLEDENVIKVLHACSEDLQVFNLCTGVVPQPLFDTQLAAGFLGEGLSIGYQKLVKIWSEVELSKEETRSDWLKRPLDPAQQQYAAQDVVYLNKIYEDQRTQLEVRGTLGWVMEDCQRMINDALHFETPENYYKRVKVAWRLSGESLCILKHLCAWREVTSRERDIPRSHLIPERSLWPISRYKPHSIKALSRVDGMNRHLIRKDGEKILSIVKEAQTLDRREWPPSVPKPLPPSVGSWVKKLKKMVSSIGKEYGIAPEILFRKKYMDELIRSGYPKGEFLWPSDLNGWRNEVIAEELLTELERLAIKDGHQGTEGQ